MTQNRSAAVMAQNKEPHDSLNFFPTPLWATRALCEYVIDIRGRAVWEPACGEGHMVRALKEYAASVRASDVHNYGWGHLIADFLFLGRTYEKAEWIITNPPFQLAEEFICTALDVSTRGVAIFARTQFIESIGRYERLFRDRPPSIVAQFSERVPIVKGVVDEDVSSATAYCWLVWVPGKGKTHLMWIPPCRPKLDRVGDYL